MKTVKEWFESIKDEDVRRMALANCVTKRLKLEASSLHTALICSFRWSESEEGWNYWNEQHEKALNNEL